MIPEAALAAALLVSPAATVTVTHSVPSGCKDKTAVLLHKAGFHGNKNRIAWAVTWRESNHRNLDESSPWYSGALGMWQIQTSAHSGNAWWSRSAMLNPERQSRIVFRYMTRKGRDWSAWGLNSTGTGMDTSQYGGWSSAQQYAWIWAPYERALAMYPNRCAR